jgi:hypothetical protein
MHTALRNATPLIKLNVFLIVTDIIASAFARLALDEPGFALRGPACPTRSSHSYNGRPADS